MKPTIALLTFLLVVATVARAHENEREPPNGTIGLVKLPMLFGQSACDRFQAKTVQLFSDASGRTPLGQVQVTKQWVFPKEGGCSGLEVSVLLNGTGVSEPLPTLEHEYEAPAGIVLAKSGHWCQIQLRTRSAWIREGCDAGFLPVQALFHGKMLYLRLNALDLARETPEGTEFKSSRSLRDARAVSASLVNLETVRGRVWLHVAASHVSSCEREPSPAEVQRFWLPLRDETGALQVWFHSRGC